jgi:hypothetical protein
MPIADAGVGPVGQDHHAQVLLPAGAADEAQHGPAVAAGEVQVHDQDVEVQQLVDEQLQAARPLRGRQHLQAAGRQGPPEQPQHRGVVVEQQRLGSRERRSHVPVTPPRGRLFTRGGVTAITLRPTPRGRTSPARWLRPGCDVDTRIVHHYFRVMRNVTITLDEEVARWARVQAAERDTSVSRLVGEMLRERMLEARSYEGAMEAFLSQRPRKLRRSRLRYPRRDALHER